MQRNQYTHTISEADNRDSDQFKLENVFKFELNFRVAIL